MAIAPDIMEQLLVELCRFLIEAADVAREIAPARTPERAAYELTCANAAVDTLRCAIATRDREQARAPLNEVAKRLGIALDDQDPDWQRLAYRALRVMLDAEEENARRDQGVFSGPSGSLQSARNLVDAAAYAPVAKFPASIIAASTLQFGSRAHPGEPTAPTAEAANEEPVPLKQPQPESGVTPGPVVISRENAPAQAHKGEAAKAPTIEEGADAYIAERTKGYRTFRPNEQANEKAGESWARNSGPNVLGTKRLIVRILGNKPFDQITDAELKSVWEIIARVPRSYQANTSKLTPQEAADEADAAQRRNQEATRSRLQDQGASPGKIESEILKDRIRRLRVATIYRHMQDFQRMCVFLKKKGLLVDNIMADHIWDSQERLRREILEEDNERLTWGDKLKELFRSPIYQRPLEDKGDPMYWAPLIAVHMGLRSEEALQLYVSDIQIIDDIPCIKLKQGPGQSLKSKAAKRTVPIHENLIKLGFMRLIDTLQRQGEPRLFPWLERSESKKTFTEGFSKRFTKYRKDNNIYDPQRDFHSFRTTFNDSLIQASCLDSRRRSLVGHVEHDVGITNYNPTGFATDKLRDDVNSVVIDISMIRSPFEDAASAPVTSLFGRKFEAAS